MKKYKWIMILVLIGVATTFYACEYADKMTRDLLTGPEMVEPPETTPPETTPPEMMPPDMPPDMMAAVDVLIYTGSTWWIEQMVAMTAAGITESRLNSNGIEAMITDNEESVREWMLLTNGDGKVNVLITYGVIPNSIYGAGNTQPDGSVAEDWIETTDGDTILNHANYIGFTSTEDPNEAALLTEEQLLNFSWSNDIQGLQNLMDNPDISLYAPIPVGQFSFGGFVAMNVTPDGSALTPSLVNFESNRAIPLKQLQGDWFAERVFASDTGNSDAEYADPVIIRDGTLGRLAIIHGTALNHDMLRNGEVAAEMIINYLIADAPPPPVVTMPEEMTQPTDMVEMPEEPEQPDMGIPPDMIMQPLTEAVKIYYTDNSNRDIRKANLDGSNRQIILETHQLTNSRSDRPYTLNLDQLNGKMYWHMAIGKIYRANFDGTNIETLPHDIQYISGSFALDPVNEKIYWINRGLWSIHRANLDGTNVEDLVNNLTYTTRNLRLDLVNGKMYWIDNSPGNVGIQRANLDGSDIEDIYRNTEPNPNILFDIAIDSLNGKIYWTVPDSSSILRANLDGTDVDSFIRHVGPVTQIALDVGRGKIYHSNLVSISRSNLLDGSDTEVILPDAANNDIALEYTVQ